MARENIDILLGVETHLREGSNNINFKGFEFFCTNMEVDKRKGGGIACWTKTGISTNKWYITRDKYNNSGCNVNASSERHWQLFNFASGKKFSVGIVYMGVERNDNRTLNEQIQMALIQEGKTLKSRGYDLLIIGDFNGHVGEIDNGTEDMIYKNRNANFN